MQAIALQHDWSARCLARNQAEQRFVTFVHPCREKQMRFALLALAGIVLAACSTEPGPSEGDSGSAVADQKARQECAKDGKRVQLRGVHDNADGTRSYEYQCVR